MHPVTESKLFRMIDNDSSQQRFFFSFSFARSITCDGQYEFHIPTNSAAFPSSGDGV